MTPDKINGNKFIMQGKIDSMDLCWNYFDKQKKRKVIGTYLTDYEKQRDFTAHRDT